IVVPVSVPAIAAYGIFQFLWVWNDLLMALVFVQDSSKYPMTRAIQNLLSQYGTEWHLLAAGAFLLMIVPLIVFFSLHRYFVQGLLAGSIKSPPHSAPAFSGSSRCPISSASSSDHRDQATGRLPKGHRRRALRG